MANQDEIRRLILEVVGEDRLRSLREQVDKEKESLVALTGALSHLTPAQISQDQAVQDATAKLASLNSELKKAEGAHMNLGYAALEASRGLEDLQYGVGGVVNNIPGLVMALGGTAGLTAAISLLSVGVNQLIKHWGDFRELFEKRWKVPEATDQVENLTDKIKKNREEMEKLEKQTKLTFSQMDKYSELVTKTAAQEARLAEERKIRSAAAQVGEEKPEQVERGAAFVKGTKGYQKEIEQALVGQGYTKATAQRIIGLAARGGQVSINEIEQAMIGAKGIPSEVVERLQESMFGIGKGFEGEEAELKEMDKIPGSEQAVAEMQVLGEEQQDRAKVIADQVRMDKSVARKRAAEAKQAAKHAENMTKQAARQAESREKAEATHEAGLLEDAFGEQIRLAGAQMLAGGIDPREIQSRIANQMMMQGASRQGAEQAAVQQIEKIVTGAFSAGGAGASLLQLNARMTHEMAQRQHAMMEMYRQSQQELEAAHQWNGKTGGL